MCISELKIFGCWGIFMGLNLADVQPVFSILGSVIFMGFTLNKWILLRKNKKDENDGR